MKIGEKIRVIREVKGITPKTMADELEMTLGGYLKIERNEVDVNTDKIEKISNLLGVKPYELLVEDKIVLNFSNNEFTNGAYGGINNINFPEELKHLYNDKIKLLEDKVKYLEDKLKFYEGE